LNGKDHRKDFPQGEPAGITPDYRPGQAEKPAPCQQGCVNCGDIRGWIAAVAQRHKTGRRREDAYADAWRLITQVNPFPATLGRICPHPCENHCNRAELDEPLAINALERFLGDYAIETGLPLTSLDDIPREQWIGVVGAGPSGLSFAYQMARRGYRVTVYDARKKAGGMLRYGVPDYRLPQAILDAEIEKITDLGVELQLDTCVGRDVSLAVLRERHDCLYIALGAQSGVGLNVPGANGPSVVKATDFLDNVNRGQRIATGDRVVVVGGGNSAVDAARCARRHGAEVTILYRRSLEDMPAARWEIQEAVEEGVQMMLHAAIVRIEREADGRMTRLVIQHMQAGTPDSSGRAHPEPVPDSEFFMPADTVIAAISQRPSLEGFESLRQDHGWLITDESGAADDNVWVGGDLAGPGIAGEAIVQGRLTAEQLHARFSGEALDACHQTQDPAIGSGHIRLASKSPVNAVIENHLPGRERVTLGMVEVKQTISEAQFLAEVERCFSCGSCFGCEQCYMYCTSNCFTRVEEPRPGMYFTLNLDTCRECGKCIEVCPCGFIEPA
jgi:formate dehydrogenase major subunit